MSRGRGKAGDFRVVISGGGLVGSTLALRLCSMNYQVTLVDPSRDLHLPPSAADRKPVAELGAYDLRVSALSPASIQLLSEAGVWDEVSDMAQSCDSMLIWDSRHGGEIGFDALDMQRSNLGFVIENTVLLDALQLRLRSEAASGRLVLVNGRVKRVAPPDQGRREIQIDTGKASPLLLSADLLIGADGPGSPTRKLLDIPAREWDYGQQAIVATVRMTAAHEGRAWQHFTPTGPLALLPINSWRMRENTNSEGRLVSIVWSQDHDVARELMSLDDTEFLQRLSDTSEYCLGTALEVGRRFAVPLRQCHARTYYRAAAVLVGDAAHVIHPLAGRGVNLGFSDVAVLTESLQRASERGLAPGHAEVLRRHELRRKPDNLAVMALMEGFHRGFTSRSTLLNRVLNEGMSAVNALFPLKRRIMALALH